MIEANVLLDQSVRTMYKVTYEVTIHPKEYVTATIRDDFYIDTLDDLDELFISIKESSEKNNLSGVVSVDNHSATLSCKEDNKDIRIFTREVNKNSLEEIKDILDKKLCKELGKA